LEKDSRVLSAGLVELGIEPAADIVAAFDSYRVELKKWNKVHNLTSITDDEEIVVKHFLDSLIYLKAIPAEAETLCDVGSGGGFPGLPIAIIRRDLRITLLEPARKKIVFLRQMRRLLSLPDIEVIEDRAEGVTDRQFDCVVTRATFSIADMLKKAGHLVKQGGALIMSKGPNYEEELADLPGRDKIKVLPVSMKIRPLSRNLIVIPKPL
jgi:16S rRNA (guanine527-N7)-methyltransferase